ncbi:histone-lysine N-methyltransferase set-1-like, partial [Clarias magur]
RGVFASMSVDKGCFILEYRGELLSQEESRTRQTRYNETENTFLFDFDWNGRQWCVGASKEDGSLGRLVNDEHKTPNCKMKIISVKGKPHFCLFSIKDIAPGEEITYSYGDSDWPWHKLMTRAVTGSGENTAPEDETRPPTKPTEQMTRAVTGSGENTAPEDDTRPPTKPTEQVNRFTARLNRLREHHDKCAQHYEQLLRTRESEPGVTGCTQNYESEISCEASASDYSDEEYIPDSDCSSPDNSAKSEELKISHPEPETRGPAEFK